MQALASYLHAFERHYSPLGKGVLDLRKAIRALTPRLDGDLREAEEETTTAANELTVHACTSVLKHRLQGPLKNISRDAATVLTNLKATVRAH